MDIVEIVPLDLIRGDKQFFEYLKGSNEKYTLAQKKLTELTELLQDWKKTNKGLAQIRTLL